MSESKIKKSHSEISAMKTPRCYVEERQGFDYVEEGYMRRVLNEYFPIWSWEISKYEVLADVIIVHGKLRVSDNGVSRSFDAIAAHRIATSKKGTGFVDLGNDLKAANSDCFKVACNRLCNVADDVYRKAILNIKQVEVINGYLEKLNDVGIKNKVHSQLSNNKINTTNYDKTIDRLIELTKDNGGKK